MLSQGRLVLVDTGGLLGEVIVTELGDRDDVCIVGDIEEIDSVPGCQDSATVCVVFGFVDDLTLIRKRLAAQFTTSPLVVLIDHTDPFITLFRLSEDCVKRQRMGLQQLIETLQKILDDGITFQSDTSIDVLWR